jgi:hypothetical protein
VARDFDEGVGGAGAAASVFDEGEGFHEVDHGDGVVGDADVDGGGGGAEEGCFRQAWGGPGFVPEGEEDDLDGGLVS